MMTTVETDARALSKPERAARLRACGWQRVEYGGVQSWRPPGSDEHHAWWTLAAAIREQLRRDRRAALPHVGGIPVVPLKREVVMPLGERVWVIDCPYCGREHTHGAEAGHRVSHCRHAGSDPGYIIEHPADDDDLAEEVDDDA